MLLKKAGIRFSGMINRLSLKLQKATGLTPQALYRIMKSASTRSGKAAIFPDSPPSGFGQQTLTKVCDAYGLDLKGLMRLMAERGIKADPGKTVKEVAQKNGKNPMAIFEMIHEAAER
jgi:hypothetical protein